jgi:autotransporter-associated beta strand protein
MFGIRLFHFPFRARWAQVVLAAGLPIFAGAATLTWDVTSGDGSALTDGAGNWTNGAGNWNDGVGDVNWNNANPDSAIFGAGSPGGPFTVTLGGPITTGGIAFNAGNTYTITGNTLTLSGTPTISVDPATSATISSILAGTGFNKTGTGTLTIGGASANTYTGLITVSNGTLSSAGTVGDGSIRGNVSIASGATFRLNASNSIVNNSLITVASGGTFNRNGFGDVIGALSGGGDLIGAGGLTLDLVAGSPQTFSGNISGGNLNVRGYAGTGGAKQTLTGTTSIGGIQVQRPDTAGDNSWLELGGAGTTTLTGNMEVGVAGGGNGTARLDLSGTHVLGAANFMMGQAASQAGVAFQSGGTVNLSGRLQVGHYPTHTSTYTLNSGVINLTAANPGSSPSTAGAAETSGGIYLGVDGAGELIQNGGTINTKFLVLDNRGDTVGVDTYTMTGGTLNLQGSWGLIRRNASATVNLGGGTILASVTTAFSSPAQLTGTGGDTTVDTASGATITFNGALSGPGGFTKEGPGGMMLASSTASSFDGDVVSNRGTLTIRQNNSLGSTVGSTTINGNDGATSATLALNPLSGGLTIAEPLFLNGNASGRATLQNAAGSNNWTGPITVSAVNNLVQITNSGGSLTVSGDITGSISGGAVLFLRGGGSAFVTGSIDLTTGSAVAKTDDGSWTIGAVGKTYTFGSFSNARGTVNMAVDNVLPAASILSVGQGDNANAIFNLNGTEQTVAGLGFNLGTGGTKAITSTAAGGLLTVNNSGNFTYGAQFTGGNNLEVIKQGSGDLNLTGNYSAGTFTVDGGTVNLNPPSGDGFNPVSKNILVNAGGTLRYTGGNKINNNVRVTVASGGTFNMNGQADVIGQLSGGGTLLMTGNLSLDGYANPSSQDFSGTISGGGGLTLRNITGTQTLSNPANSYTGKTILDSGVLHVPSGSEATLGNPAPAADALRFNGGTLQVTTNDLTLDDAGRNITIQASGGTFDVDSGRTLSFHNTISGAAGQLNKSGAGTFDLTGGVNHVLGSVAVNQGTLRLSAGTIQTPTLTVASGATYHLASGKLRLDALNIGGDFEWTGSTLAHYTTGTSLPMVTDHSSPGFQEVGTGRTAVITGDLSSGAGAVLALNNSPMLYESLGIRYNNYHIIGSLALAGVGDVLEMELNPYLLRPFSSQGPLAEEYGSLPLVTWTGAWDGSTFDLVSGITDDGRGFTLSTFAVSSGSALDVNTYFLEYDGANQTLWFHYKVNGYVPEPDTFALLALSVLGLRTARTLRQRRERLSV